MKKIIISLVVAFVIGITAYYIVIEANTQYQTGSFANLSNENLIKTSDVIIRGTVKDILPSKWVYQNDGGKSKTIVTDVSFDVNEVLKGIPYNDKNINVRVWTGKVGLTTYKSDIYPDFKIGEEYILYLAKDTSIFTQNNENYYIVDGSKMGAFIKSNNSNNSDEFSSFRETISKTKLKEEIEKVKENKNN